MGYYNMAAGDAPAFAFIGNHYAMSDNYHQAIMAGTGANHITIGAAHVAVYRKSHGQLATPPAPQIENPNPMPGTNNYYSQDGYSGGSSTECADPKAPGVASIDSYLAALTYTPYRNGDCTPGAYYLLNNYNPGYNPNGTPANLAKNPYTVPPQTFPTIADDLQSHHLSWGYFGQGWNNGKPTSGYCGICDCCR
jgi:phospholipase C